MPLPPSPLQAYLRANPWPFYVSWVISFVLMLVLVCVESARRKYPTNFLLLGAFTIAEAFLVGGRAGMGWDAPSWDRSGWLADAASSRRAWLARLWGSRGAARPARLCPTFCPTCPCRWA